MDSIILRNSRAEQYLCAARKNFIMKDGCLSESHSKTVFCHFSDLHSDWERFTGIIKMLKYYKPDFAVHTGDVVCWDSAGDTSIFYDEINKIDIPVYNCIGNHETFCGDKTLKNEDLHERYIKPLKNIHTTGKAYYYTDFPEHNIRLIVLNDYDNDEYEKTGDRDKYEILQEQCDWFVGALKECEKNEMGVMIASHECDEPILPGSDRGAFCQRFEPSPWGKPAVPETHIISAIVDAFQNGTALKESFVWKKSGKVVNVDCAFEKKSEFICYLNGHRHGDYIGYLKSFPKQLTLGMTCSGCFPEGYHNIGDEVSDLSRIPGTVSEDAVNFCVLDREKRTVTVVRIGACVNDLMEERIAAVYHY